MTLTQAGLFEGYGGLSAAVAEVAGAELAWYSEIEPAACRVLEHHHPDVDNLGDITAVDWDQVPQVDILTGGFPCTDVSSAGLRAGIRPDTRSGLWNHMAKAIDGLRPQLVVIENVRGLLSAHADSAMEPCPWCVGNGPGSGLRALGAVLGDLVDLGYDARWCGLRAADVGAPHGRFRIFITAWPAAAHPGSIGRGAGSWSGVGRDEAVRGEASENADDGGRATAHADGIRQTWAGAARSGRGGSADDDHTPADAGRDGREGGEERDLWPEGGEPAPFGRDAAGRVLDASGWGQYEPAIRRWESILGRVAPAPTQTGSRGGQQLSPRFVEWMQGLPDGHVTGVPRISRNDQLKMLGNGVCPPQAAAALRFLLAPSVMAVAA